jgi:hypothetical protein
MKAHIKVAERGESIIHTIAITLAIFCIIFSFRIPLFYSSVIFIALLLLVFSLFYISRRVVDVLLHSLSIKIYLSTFLFLLILIFIYGVLHYSYDFTRISSILSNLVVLLVILLLCNYIFYAVKVKYSNPLMFCSKYIYYAFALQSIIILLCAISPSVLDIVQIFQLSGDSERAEKYKGVRGLALASAQFFPLSAAFVLGQLFSAYYLAFKEKLTLINIYFFFLIALCGLTAGRTSIIGLISSLLFIFILAFTYKSVKRRFIQILTVGSLSLISLFFMLLTSSYSDLVFDVFLPFAFEFVYSYLETGELTTSSTSILSDMYWALPLEQFMLGYGYYRNNIGNPFMGTDGGYMRNILFFGFVGCAYVVVGQLINIVLTYKVNKGAVAIKLFLSILTFLILILHYKGEVLLHLVSIQTMLFLVFLTPFVTKK